MKYNLIFTGLDEQADENCENKLRHFIYQEMKIPERIEFGNIHRFGKRLLSSISGGNCSLTPKWVPLRFLPAFLTLSKSE
jgi:hypothetical protein